MHALIVATTTLVKLGPLNMLIVLYSYIYASADGYIHASKYVNRSIATCMHLNVSIGRELHTYI
jgi:predicted trehalose synthase